MNKYITRDDYLIAKGVDLNLELFEDDNHSNKVDRFIKEVADWCVDYLLKEYHTNELNDDFNNLAEFRQKRFRAGVIEQINYILDNGWVSKASGINKDTGLVVDYSQVQLGRNAFNEFYLGAFCNIKRSY